MTGILMTLVLTAGIILLAVFMQGLFAGYETGFVSTNLIRIRHLAVEERNERAARMLGYLNNPGRMLTTLLIGTNVAVVGGSIALMAEFRTLNEDFGVNFPREFHEVVATLIVTPLFLVFSEIIPKSVFRQHPNRLSLALLPIIELFYLALAPLAAPIAWGTSLLMRAVGGREQYLAPLMSSVDDVRVLVDESAEHGTIEAEEQRMIHSIIDLGTTRAKEIMVPRIDMKALSEDATREELFHLFEESGLSRIPVYRDTIDSVVGVINAHAVLTDPEPDNPDITRFIREVRHVPDSMMVDDLFAEMKRNKEHMAIVTDEYGGTDGLVTLEDILEEIFGEIHDEHDTEERAIQRVGTRAWVVDARTSLAEVSEQVGIEFEDEAVETIGGWVMHIAGRIPAQGEVISYRGLRLTVLAGGNNYVAKVRLEITDEYEEDREV